MASILGFGFFLGFTHLVGKVVKNAGKLSPVLGFNRASLGEESSVYAFEVISRGFCRSPPQDSLAAQFRGSMARCIDQRISGTFVEHDWHLTTTPSSIIRT